MTQLTVIMYSLWMKSPVVKTHLRIGPMKSLVCLKCQLVEMYVNKGFKRRWTVSLDAECNDKNGNNVFSYVLLNYGIELHELCREVALYSVKISVLKTAWSLSTGSCVLCIVLFLKSWPSICKNIARHIHFQKGNSFLRWIRPRSWKSLQNWWRYGCSKRCTPFWADFELHTLLYIYLIVKYFFFQKS